MSSLKELRERLSKLQLKSSKLTLSQSECVDILLKISSIRNLNLFTTNDGMYLLTPKQVENEILKLLENEGGRVELLQVSAYLDLNFNIIEKTLSEIMDKSPSSYYIEQGILMNTAYLNNLIDSINCKLKGLGIIKLSDLSTEYNLSTVFISKILQNKELNKFNGIIKKSHVENDSYRTMLVKIIKAALIATFVEVSLSEIALVCCCDEDTLKSILGQILSKNPAFGIVRSNKFIPYSYIINKQNEVINYFSSNGYVNKSRFNEYLIDINDSYSTIIDNSVALSDVYIKKSYLQQDAINNNSWRSLESILPNSLSHTDVQTLVKLSTNIIIDTEYRDKSHGLIFQDYIFISKRFLDDLVLISSHFILNLMKSSVKDFSSLNATNEKKASWITRFNSYSKTLVDIQSNSPINKSKKNKKKSTDSAQSNACEIDKTDIELVFKSLISTPIDQLNAFNEIDIMHYFNDSEHSFTTLWNIINEPLEFTAIIFDELLRTFNRLFKEKHASSDKIDISFELSAKLEANYTTFHYSYKGLKFLGVTDWNNPITIHICKNIMMKALEHLIEIYQIKFNINLGDLSNKKQVFEKLTKQGIDVKNLIAFYDSITNKNLDSVADTCYQAAEDANEYIRIPNKKNEKEYINAKIKLVKSQAKSMSIDDHLSICHIFLNYTLLLNGQAVDFPSQDWSVKYMASLISACKKIKLHSNHDISSHLNLYLECKVMADQVGEAKLNELSNSSQALLSFIIE